VQGLISIGTGPNGGAKIEKVPFSSAFQHLQSYLYFTDLSAANLYAVRAIVEPELIAGAIPHLTKADIAALEHSIAICEVAPRDHAHAVLQRKEDLAFHAIIARAHPNPLLRFIVEFVNEALQQLVVTTKVVTTPANRRFGEANVHAHHEILDAIKAHKLEKARVLMRTHVAEVEAQVMRMHTTLAQRLVLDSELKATTRSRAGAQANTVKSIKRMA
jgi:DNA-binding FadR family transcriptional regulator